VARSFVAASSQYLEAGSALVTAEPLTMAAWVKPQNITGADGIMEIGVNDTGATRSGFRLILRGNVAGDPINATKFSGSTFREAATTTGFTAGTWHHAAGVWSATNDRAAYIDGGSKGTNTQTVTFASTPDRTWIGRVRGLTNYVHSDLDAVAEAAIWNVALSDAEIALLAKGLSLLLIQRGAIAAYWPLFGVNSPEPDWKGVANLTLNGAPAKADHKAIFYRGAALVPFGADSGSSLVRLVTESAELAEAIARIRALLRLEAESIEFVEAAPWTRSRLQALAEGVEFAETLEHALGRVAAAAEAIELAEGPVRSLGLNRALADTVEAAEAVVRAGAIARLIVEGLALDEATLERLVADLGQALSAALTIMAAVAGRPGASALLAAGLETGDAVSGVLGSAPALGATSRTQAGVAGKVNVEPA